MVKLIADSTFELISTITYLTGEYGVPSTQFGKELLSVNLANIVANGNFSLGNVNALERVLGNSKCGIVNHLGNEFYTYLSDVSTNRKINSNLPDLVKANSLYEIIIAWEKEHLLSIGESSTDNELSLIPDIDTDQITIDTQDNEEQGTEQEDSELQEFNKPQEFAYGAEVDVDSQEELEMALDKADSLELLLELFRRASEANKLKTLEVTLSNETIDNLTAAIAESLSSSPDDNTTSNNTTKHSWSTSAKLLPTPKKIYGVDMNKVKESLSVKKAMIIEGVPGTGKSVLMFNLINELSENNPNRFRVVSFSQTTSYSEFIEGIRNVNGNWEYADGTFLSFCKLADADREHNYYFGIDEISRGNTESIFGEAMTAIESRDTIITLQSGNSIVIPSNLYIIGTMNTLDKSSKNIDRATADRFAHYRLEPQWTKEYIDGLCAGYSAKAGIEFCSSSQKLSKLCVIMQNVNSVLIEDSAYSIDNVIGTRAISVPDLSIDAIRHIIHESIIPDIRSKQNMCSISTANKLDNLIMELDRL